MGASEQYNTWICIDLLSHFIWGASVSLPLIKKKKDRNFLDHLPHWIPVKMNGLIMCWIINHQEGNFSCPWSISSCVSIYRHLGVGVGGVKTTMTTISMYWVLPTFWNALSHFILVRILFYSPILQIGKLSVRKDEGLDQGHKARKEQC